MLNSSSVYNHDLHKCSALQVSLRSWIIYLQGKKTKLNVFQGNIASIMFQQSLITVEGYLVYFLTGVSFNKIEILFMPPFRHSNAHRTAYQQLHSWPNWGQKRGGELLSNNLFKQSLNREVPDCTLGTQTKTLFRENSVIPWQLLARGLIFFI